MAVLQCDCCVVPKAGAAALGSPSLTLRRDGLWDPVLTGPSLVAASLPQMSLSSPRWPSSGPSVFCSKGRVQNMHGHNRASSHFLLPAGPSALPLRGSETRGTEVVCAVWRAGAAQETTLPGPLHGTETST